MRYGDDASSPPPDPGCNHNGRRNIHLRLPYVEASMVRARLLYETGDALKVSALSRTDGVWTFSICRECPKSGPSR